ncbi:MAG: hypothetical protein ABWZ64_13230, partial [Xanthobacteraceae bacterium]
SPSWKGLGADSEEKHEPASDIDAAVVVDSLKALDPNRPIREADMEQTSPNCPLMTPSRREQINICASQLDSLTPISPVVISCFDGPT